MGVREEVGAGTGCLSFDDNLDDGQLDLAVLAPVKGSSAMYSFGTPYSGRVRGMVLRSVEDSLSRSRVG